MLNLVALTLKPVDETLVYHHSNESYQKYFHVVLFIALNMVVLTFKSGDETLTSDYSNESH